MTQSSHALALPDVVPESREVLAKHARSFKLASVFLAPDRRDDASVCYAFCRLLDDTADEAPTLESALEGVETIRAELLGKRRARPLVAAWRIMALRTRIPVRAALDLVDGVRSDLEPVRVADDAELLRYAYRVAGTVGLMMCGVLGVKGEVARRHAIDLGVAMQLTNIARDVAEDARMGRVYLPRTRLEAAGTSPEALLEGRADPAAVSTVVRDLLAVAEVYYRSADAGMPHIPFRSRVAVLAASRLYRQIGRVLLARGADPLQGRTVVGWFGKAAALLAALGAAWFDPVATGRRRVTHDAGLHASLHGFFGVNG